MNSFECEICLHVNHAMRYHCSTCGTVPTRYSPTHGPISITEYSVLPVVRAHGCQSIERWHFVKVNLRTCALTEFASE